jgi:bifunctional non-homologous end joining protein LigD
MLAEIRESPFSAPGWLFELKYDGFRLVAARERGQARLVYRRGADSTAVFPEIAQAVGKLPYDGVVLDGEVVVLDDDSRPVFQKLQQRALLQRSTDIARATLDLPATYYAFDLLGFEGFDLRPLPLVERKALLRRILPHAGPIRFCDHVEEHGEALYEEVRRRGLEGLVAKKADGPYRAGRSSEWLKIRVDRTREFVIVGFTHPEGNRTGFGALHLGEYEDGALVYAGRAGSGFGARQLVELRATLDGMIVPRPPCGGPVPKGAGHSWVAPRLVCEVRYKEWTREQLLRQPVFLRLRDDKTPHDCVRGAAVEHEPPLPAPPPAVEARRVPFTNLDKVFWPEDGYTKGDLVAFYRAVAPWLLPFLRDRPLVLTRFPDGIHGKSFFQKDTAGRVPGWLHTERIWSEHAERAIDYFVCGDEEGLLYIANMGTIPLHVFASRLSSIDRPDWCILDLDPKGAPFESVVRLARALRDLCDEMELPAYCKTSGSTGLHVLVPLGGQCTYDECRTLGELMARVVCDREPERATTARAVGSRGGRVYVDFLQNGHGKLLVSPYCVRPLPGAPVSTPLAWSEVDDTLDPRTLTIKTLPARLASIKEDPLRKVLKETPDLAKALARLRRNL